MDVTKNYIAIDLGASSGRLILGSVKDNKIFLEELHRFENGPIENNGSLQWDFAKLTAEIEEGLKKAVKRAGKIESISVDSWGVDFGLLDNKGNLLENPYHYRDKRTDTMMDEVFSIVPKRQVYEITGIQFLQFNSIYQLMALKLQRPQLLEKTDKILFMADLVANHLCGEIFSEYTLASTSQLLDMKKSVWSDELFKKLSLPLNIMPKVIQPGSVVGKLKKQLAKKIGSEQIPIVATGSHDTACAVASVPAVNGNNWAYLSSGTWSLAGIEIPKPLINENTYKYQFTNEGGAYSTIRLLKNIMGLWLIQECRRNWNQQGEKLSFATLAAMAEKSPAFKAVINPNDTRFLSPCDMPTVINDYLAEKGFDRTNDKGRLIRIIIESLAFYYRRVLDILEDITGKKIDVLHLVGGGIQNELLCQFTANSIGRKVVAGPVEATAMGNIMIQAIAAGQIKNISEGRKIIGNSVDLKVYQPIEHEVWNKKYQQVKNIFDI
jgi:rhamnulokinase